VCTTLRYPAFDCFFLSMEKLSLTLNVLNVLFDYCLENLFIVLYNNYLLIQIILVTKLMVNPFQF